MKNRVSQFFLVLMILLYVGAGINHFVKGDFYEKMMPTYIPFHWFCVFFSGICEIVFALLLIPQRTRKIAAQLIMVMLVIFFVIHIQMLIDNWDNDDVMFWASIIRIPLQFVLIWWAYQYTKNPQLKAEDFKLYK